MATLKQQIKTKLDSNLTAEKEKRKSAMASNKGNYKTLSSKGIRDSESE